MTPQRAPFIGAIADDLTGATDLALILSRGGMKVRQVVGIPAEGADLSACDAIVVSLKSRTIPADQAVDQSVAAATALLATGVQQLFFKYCSTFDSSDAGNIGPVIEAVLDLVGEDRTLACPAFPTNQRTVYKGHLFVGDTLLSDSSMKDHPLTPMRDSNLVRLLGAQTTLPVSLVDIDAVRAGPESVRAALNAKPGVAIVDALSDADLMIIGTAARDMRLITGGSGVAIGLPMNFDLPARRPRPKTRASSGRAAVIAGSCSAATLRQIDTALSAGLPGFRVDPVDLAEGRITAADAIAFAHAGEPDRVPIIYATAPPEVVSRGQLQLGRDRAGEMIETFLGAVAVGLADTGFDRLLVAGGETSGAVIAALGIHELDVGPEIDPGVPWMLADRLEHPISIALKSGNFGADNIFLAAWDKLS